MGVGSVVPVAVLGRRRLFLCDLVAVWWRLVIRAIKLTFEGEVRGALGMEEVFKTSCWESLGERKR